MPRSERQQGCSPGGGAGAFGCCPGNLCAVGLSVMTWLRGCRSAQAEVPQMTSHFGCPNCRYRGNLGARTGIGVGREAPQRWRNGAPGRTRRQGEIGRPRLTWDFRHYRSDGSNRTVDHASRRRSGSPERRGTRMNCRLKTRFLEGADQSASGVGGCARQRLTGLSGEDAVGCTAGTPTLGRCHLRGGPSPKERSRRGGCR